jgi:hypothetical protein
MSVAFGTYLTSDSSYVDDVVRGLATLVEARNTVTWDLFAEDEDANSIEVTWYDSVRYELSGEVGTGGWNNTDTAALPIDSDLNNIVQIGDVLKLEDEVVVVSGVNRTASTIDVHERGTGDTSGASHIATIAIYVIGSAHVESTVDQDGLLEDNVERKNYMQLIEEPVIVSKSAKNQQYKDIADKVDEVRAKALSRAMRKMNLSLLFGEKRARTSTKPSTLGGMDYWLRQSGAINDNYSGTFTEAKFKATIQRIAARGGSPDTVIMSPAQKAVFNDLNNTYTQTGRDEKTAGQIISFYEADDVGVLRLVADPLLADDFGTMYIVNSKKISKVWFKDDALKYAPEPANSRTFHETLQGQYTLRMKDVFTDHARVYGL